MQNSDIKLFVSFESDQAACAERLDSWERTNKDIEAYNAREQFNPDDDAAEAFKASILSQILAADVTVCLISQTAFLSKWLAWELEQSRQGKDHNGLVGIVLHEFDTHPPAMLNQGAIFVPFKRDTVRRAIEWAVSENYTSGNFTLRDL